MKKIILSLMLLFSVCFLPVVAKADYQVGTAYTTQIEQAQTIEQLRTQLIALITQLIQVLQTQLVQIQAQQTTPPATVAPAPAVTPATVDTTPSPTPQEAPGSVPAPQNITLSTFTFPDQSRNFRNGVTTTLYSFAITNNTDSDITTQQLSFNIALNSAEGKTLSSTSFKLFRDPSFTGTGSVSVQSWDNSTLVLGIAKTTIKAGQSVIFTLYTTPNVFFKLGDTVTTSLIDDGNGNTLGAFTITAY